MCTRVYQSRDLLMLDARTLRDFVTPILNLHTHTGSRLPRQRQKTNNDGQQTMTERWNDGTMGPKHGKRKFFFCYHSFFLILTTF
jgi:hypothetical protein